MCKFSLRRLGMGMGRLGMGRLGVGLVLAGLGIAMLAPLPAHAQFGSSDAASQTGLGSASQRMLKRNPTAKPEAPQPAAVPGTRVSPEAAAPTRSAAEMSPTEALFDAINRGDSPAARDAVNRGANLGAHNAIGLTPLELSVDLGRNDISFLLLSMRGDDAGSGRRGTERGSAERRDLAAGRAARVAPEPSAIRRPGLAAPRRAGPDGPVRPATVFGTGRRADPAGRVSGLRRGARGAMRAARNPHWFVSDRNRPYLLDRRRTAWAWAAVSQSTSYCSA